jgi:hypothetical protein
MENRRSHGLLSFAAEGWSLNMRAMCCVTYEIITPESAEEGDAAERGFVHENGGEDELERIENASDYEMPLRSAMRLIDCVEDSNNGRDFHGVSEHCTDYRTGAVTTYSLHLPENITSASFERVKRLLRRERLLIGK